MVWLLPIILIGGVFFPILGYMVAGMMAFFLPLSYFKGRYWCWNLCPRGAFLDIVVSKTSLKKPVPRIFLLKSASIIVLLIALIITYIIFVAIPKDSLLVKIGALFVSICLSTTIVSIILGIATKPRTWCAIFCPMGKL